MEDIFIDEEDRPLRCLDVRAGGFAGLGDRMLVIPHEVVTEITDTGSR